LGDLQARLKKPDEAMKAYRQYLAKVPSDQTVAKAVGLHEHGAKKYKDALKYLAMVKDGQLKDAGYLLALGESYYHTGDFKAAAGVFATLDQKKPSTTVKKEYLKLLGECYEKTNEELKAADAYAAYTSIPNVLDADAAYKKAFFREKTDEATAVKYYSGNTTAYPKDYRNFVRLGLIYAKKKDYTKAATTLSRASTLVDTIAVVWQSLGEVYGKAKNEDKELAAYQKLLTLQPQDLTANRRVGMILYKKNELSQAIANLEMTLTSAPNDVEVMLTLSDAYLKTKRTKEAADLLAKARVIKKDDPKLGEQLYKLYKETGQDKKAETEIQGLIALTKDNKYRVMYVDDLMAAKRYDDANKIVNDIKAVDPENFEGLMFLAQIQRQMKKYDEAIETYKAVQYIKGFYAPALAERGDVYMLKGEPDRAKEYYEKALEADAKYAPAELGLALVAKAKKDNATYLKHLNKAKALDPKDKAVLEELKKSQQ
jgi:tetratricopeptide (TPR) repeat protein